MSRDTESGAVSPDAGSGAVSRDAGSGAAPAGVTARGRRELVLAVLACTAGAAVVLFAASRTWAVVVQARPAPLPPLRTARTGAALVPWLPALAFVGLAGAGALVATRRTGRLLVGVLLVACGLGMIAGAAAAPGSGATGSGGAAAWMVAAALGGGLVAAVGAATVARGRRWPTMGARYERSATADRPAPAGADRPRAPAEIWDAIDRGTDPTG